MTCFCSGYMCFRNLRYAQANSSLSQVSYNEPLSHAYSHKVAVEYFISQGALITEHPEESARSTRKGSIRKGGLLCSVGYLVQKEHAYNAR